MRCDDDEKVMRARRNNAYAKRMMILWRAKCGLFAVFFSSPLAWTPFVYSNQSTSMLFADLLLLNEADFSMHMQPFQFFSQCLELGRRQWRFIFSIAHNNNEAEIPALLSF